MSVRRLALCWLVASPSGSHHEGLLILGIMTPMTPWYRSSAAHDLVQSLLDRTRAAESAPSEELERLPVGPLGVVSQSGSLIGAFLSRGAARGIV